MFEPPSPARLGAAASIIGHLMIVTAGLLFTDAHPFASMPSEAISIDIVAPEEVVPPPKPAEPVATPKQPDPIDFSALTAPVKPTPSTEPQTRQQKAGSPNAAAPASPPVAAPAPPAAGAQKAAAAQQAAAAPPGAEAPQPSPSTTSQPSGPAAPEPDVTVKYGVMLGLPSEQPSGPQYSGIDAPAYEMAKVSVDEIAAFRRHLKTCSSLPATVGPTDKVRIVLRIALTRDGMLAAEPALLEASASVKGPVLMQSAMNALQACQPYTMLPADKYKEWRVLDLPFTPQDFTSG